MSDLQSMDDAELELETASRIHSAALMNRTRWSSKYHDACDEAYDECKRRARGIYQRAWNSVVRNQGHHGMVRDVDPQGV